MSLHLSTRKLVIRVGDGADHAPSSQSVTSALAAVEDLPLFTLPGMNLFALGDPVQLRMAQDSVDLPRVLFDMSIIAGEGESTIPDRPQAPLQFLSFLSSSNSAFHQAFQFPFQLKLRPPWSGLYHLTPTDSHVRDYYRSSLVVMRQWALSFQSQMARVALDLPDSLQGAMGISPGLSSTRRASTYVDCLQGFDSSEPVSSSSNAERRRSRRVLVQVLSKVLSITDSGLLEMTQGGSHPIPSLTGESPRSEDHIVPPVSPNSGYVFLPTLLSLSVDRLRSGKHFEEKQSGDVDIASFTEILDILSQVSKTILVRNPASNSTYQCAVPDFYSLHLTLPMSLTSVYAHLNTHKSTSLLVGTLSVTVGGQVVYNLQKLVTTYPITPIKTAPLSGGAGSIDMTFFDPIKGGVRRTLRVGKPFHPEARESHMNWSTAVSKVASAIYLSDGSNGLPYFEGLISSSRLNCIPLRAFFPGAFLHVFEQLRPSFEKLVDVDLMLKSLEGLSLEEDSVRYFITRLGDRDGEITPEEVVGRAVIDACYMRTPVDLSPNSSTDTDRGSWLGPPLSKNIALLAYSPPSRTCVVIDGTEPSLKHTLWSVTHSICAMYRGAFGDGLEKRPLSYRLEIDSSLFESPRAMAFTSVCSQFIPLSTEASFSKWLRALGPMTGGVWVGPDGIYFDTPLIMALDRSLSNRSYTRGAGHRTRDALYASSPARRYLAVRRPSSPPFIFSTHSGSSMLTGRSNQYSYKRSGVGSQSVTLTGAFRSAPPPEMFDADKHRDMYTPYRSSSKT